MARYEMGQRVTFLDENATTSTGEVGVAHGIVNGGTVTDDATGITYVPLWCARDNGRESTTVYVAEPNILDPQVDEEVE